MRTAGPVARRSPNPYSAGHVSGRRRRDAERPDAPSHRLGGGRGPELRAVSPACAVLAGTMICSSLQRVACRWVPTVVAAPTRDRSAAVFCLRLRRDGGEEVDQSAVGVAQDYRAVAPRHVGRLQDDLGNGLGDEALDPLPVASTSSTHSSANTERFWPGTGPASPSIPTVAGAPMAMVPVGVRSSAKTGTGRVTGRPVNCSQKVARRSTSWVMMRTETKSMTVPFAAEGGGVGVAKFALIRLDGRRRSLPAR